MAKGIRLIGAWHLVLLFALVSIMIPVAVFSAEGVLLAVTGKVAVFSHGASQPAKMGLRVRPGDNIRSMGGSVSGLLSDGRMFRVGQEDEYKVPLENAYGPAGALASRLMNTIRETLSRGKGPGTYGVERGKKEIITIYPHNANILSQDLRFEWEQLEGLDQVEITVKCPWPIYTHKFLVTPGESGGLTSQGCIRAGAGGALLLED